LSGRKTFTAGEVLQAADVNDFLMDQSVMVFAGTAARGSAIPSPSEGMVTYLEDSDELQVYTTAWGPVDTGGLIETKTAINTTALSFGSVGAGANVAVTGLSITHTMQNASNKLIMMAYFGAAANSASIGNVGIALADDGALIGIGDAAGSRARVGAGGVTAPSGSTLAVTMPHIHLLHSPGDTSSHTYTLRAINMHPNTQTLYINRSEDDSDFASRPRAVSALTIQEVAV